MRQGAFEEYRQRVVPAAEGRVLEIGIGSGLNLPLYSGRAQQVIGLDPSAYLLARSADVNCAGGIFITHGEVAIVARCVGIVVAILIVQPADIAQLAAGVEERLHPLPAAAFLVGRQAIRMLAVVP